MNLREAPGKLRWFFTEADGELGMRAACLEPGGSNETGEAAAKRRTDACVNWSEVSSRLRKVGPERERVLRLAYTPHRWPGLERWYELAGVAAWLVDREDVIAAGRRIAGQKPADAEPLRLVAKETLKGALRAFVEAR